MVDITIQIDQYKPTCRFLRWLSCNPRKYGRCILYELH